MLFFGHEMLYVQPDSRREAMSNEELINDLYPDGPGTDAILVNPAETDRVHGPDWGGVVLPWEEVPEGDVWFGTVDLGLEQDDIEVSQDEHDPTMLHFKLPVSILRIKTRAKLSPEDNIVLTFEA